MKILVCITFILGSFLTLYAQGEAGISGKVSDVKGQPVSYANITLQRVDSTFVTGCTSDEKGKFVISKLEADNYLLQISFVGYIIQVIRLDNLSRPLDIGTIQLADEAIMLQGVTVKASNVMKRVDRQIILPTDKQVKSSTSGYELLSHMQLAGLKVNSIERKITTVSGGSVQLRINDIVASTAQVQALRPDEVLRVEYIDNPGVRYADTEVEAVINYIVRRAESGISGGVSFTNAVTTGFGDDNVYIRATHKLSQFGLNYYLSYRDYDDRKVDEEQMFSFTEAKERRRELIGISTPFSYQDHSIEASYNLTKPEKYIFNAVFTENIYNSPHGDYGQLIKETEQKDLYNYTRSEYNYHSPSLDLYYKKFLPHDQFLALNVVGTYIGSDYEREYSEAHSEAGAPVSSYDYGTDGSRYSLIGEGIYQKTFDKITLTGGIKYMQAYTHNRYTGDVNESAEMHNSSLYGYVQAQGKWAKLNYSLGIGASRQDFDESEEGFTFYMFRPMLSLSYPVFKGASLRYNFTCSPSVPSLSALSDIRQQTTDLEVNRGNRNLKPYRSYINRLQLSWGNKRVSFQLSGGHRISKNPIMEQIECVSQPDGSYIIEYGIDNQKRFTQWNGRLYTNINVIPDLLSISLYGGFNSFESKGNSYLHHYTAWYVGGDASLSYKNFSLYGSIGNRYNSLYGESIDYGEKNSVIQCSYKWKNMSAGIGVLYPFTPAGWSAGWKLMSERVQKKSWTYIKNNANMVVLTFSWNFNSGLKHKTEEKLMNNVDRETGIAR